MKVLELCGGIATSYASKLLADEGAQVIKVEPPEGDPVRALGPFKEGAERSREGGVFLALNMNKSGVTLDSVDEKNLSGMLDWAEIVVHGYDLNRAHEIGLDSASLARERPHLVVLAMTPFGMLGPYSGFAAEELTLTNAGGWANLCPATSLDSLLPPLKVFGDQCAMMAGIAGALAALSFLRKSRETGTGELIDFSIQEYVCSVLEAGLPAYSYAENVIARHHPRSLIPWRIFKTKDDPVFIVCVEQDQWERLVVFMGNPDWASLEIFVDQPSRAENQDMVHTFVQEFVSGWGAHDLYHEAQKHRICVAPVMGFSSIQDNEHLRAREFFEIVDCGSSGPLEFMKGAVKKNGGRAEARTRPPELGHDEVDVDSLKKLKREFGEGSARLPLEGLRVLDMTWAWAGPFCSMNLGYLGAEVIRLESEKRSDLYRRLPIYPEGWEPTLNISGMFNQWNQGKSSLAIDLGSSEGLNIVKELVKRSDVVVQNFATGVMERLGLGYDDLRDLNPGIILASISGYGQTGPYKEYMGYGPAIPPLTGLSVGTGHLHGGPEEIGLSMPDPTAGITAALAVVGALFRRDETGVGDHLDVTLWESTAVLNTSGWMNFSMNGVEPERMGNRNERMAPHGCYPCRGEDAWVSIACSSDAHWQALAKEIDPGLSGDTRFSSFEQRKANEDEIDFLIAEWSSSRDRWDITRLLQNIGIAAFPTMTTQDIVEDSHLAERGFIERLPHPEVGPRAHSGIPWVTSNTVSRVRSSAPCLGADTDRHLKEILGYTPEHIADLYSRGVIGI